jgi:hypothetical protein
MAEDLKYGHVTLEHGHVPDDEPVVVFRARDKLLPRLLSMYFGLCKEAGSPQHHLDLITQRHIEISRWQDKNPGQVRVPRSDGYHEARREHEADRG